MSRRCSVSSNSDSARKRSRTALLCFEGDVERAGSWLLEQPRECEPAREQLAPQPLVPLAQRTLATPKEPLAASGAVDRRLFAASALQRQARAKIERRERDEARLRGLKAQEQAGIDRRRARARVAAERNLATAHRAEEHARAGRQTHAEAAEGRVNSAGRPLPQPGPPTATVPVVPETPRVHSPTPKPAPRNKDAQATPPLPAAAACRPNASDMQERKLRMLLQQESGVAADEAAKVAQLCATSGVLASEPLVLEASLAGIEMRTLMLKSALVTLRGRAGASSSTMVLPSSLAPIPPTLLPTSPLQAVLQQDAAGHPASPPQPVGVNAAERAPAARDLIEAQDEEFATALEADQHAEAEAAARAAAMIEPPKSEQAESAATTAVSEVEEEESVAELSAQEIRERRIAALDRRSPAEDDAASTPSPVT